MERKRGERAAVFEATYRDYLARVAGVDFAAVAGPLGAAAGADALTIAYFGVPYRVDRQAVAAPGGRPAPFDVAVVLCNYLLRCPPRTPPTGRWTAFKDFPDAAPLAGSFAATVERAVAGAFRGRLAELSAAADRLGARRGPEGLPYDLCRRVPALPRVELLLLFNDADAEFDADCRVLFEQRAARYLDMECLAIVGTHLAGRLRRA